MLAGTLSVLQYILALYFGLQIYIDRTWTSGLIFVLVWISVDLIRVLFAPLTAKGK